MSSPLAVLGLKLINQRFQIAVMLDTEPGLLEVAEFERSLREDRGAGEPCSSFG